MGEQEGDDDSAKVEHRQAPIADASLGLKGSWIGRTFRLSIDFMPGVWNIGWQRGGWKWRGCHTQSAFHKVRFPANLVGLSSGSIYSRIPTYLARTTHLKDHSNLLRRVVHPGEIRCLRIDIRRKLLFHIQIQSPMACTGAMKILLAKTWENRAKGEVLPANARCRVPTSKCPMGAETKAP